MTADENRVIVGRVSRARGVEGDLRVLPLLEPGDLFRPPVTITLRSRDAREFACVVEHARTFQTGEISVKCRGLDTPEDAAAWGGADVLVEASRLPAPPEGGFYYFQVEGMRVLTEDGREIGFVREVFPVPQGEIFVVERDGKELLVPSAGNVVKSIEVDRGVMVVALLEGMKFE